MDHSKNVRFLLIPLDNFNMFPFGAFLDKLRFSADDADLSQQRYCSWQIMSHTQGVVTSSSNIPVMVEHTPETIELKDVDYVVLFGSRTAHDSQQQAPLYRAYFRKVVSAGIKIVSIDNACFTLAELGLLNNHQVVVHWRHHHEFKANYPKVLVRDEQLYHFDKKLISCTGGSATIDLLIAILHDHVGQVRAEKGLADMLVDEGRGSHHRLKSSQHNNFQNRHVDRAVSLMQEHLALSTTVDEIGALIGVSRRQLDRLFQQQFDMSAHQYWQEVRLQHLHWRLIHSSHSLIQLADEIGVKDTSYLCKIFRKRFGMTPNQCRRSSLNPNQ